MKMELDIDDDMFDELLLQRLIRDHEMIVGDLKNGVHRDDMTWLLPVKNALEVLIAIYYSDENSRNTFMEKTYGC